MRRLLLFAAIATITLLIPKYGVCQDPGIPDSVAYGHPRGAPIFVGLDGDYSVPFWLKCDENLAFMHFCLATDNDFIPRRLEAYALDPFFQWYLVGTLPVNGSPADGLSSASIYGTADVNLPQPNFINTNGEWWMLGGFRMHTTSDSSALGQLVPLYPGEVPVQGVTVLYDENMNPISPAIVLSSLSFSTTLPPEITFPLDGSTFVFNKPYPFAFFVEAVDVDSEFVTISAEFSYSDYTLIQMDNEPGFARYRFSWTPPIDSDSLLQVRFIATDPNLASDTATVNLDVLPVRLAVTEASTLPGYDATVEVNLGMEGSNSNVAGFGLLFLWDPAILTVDQINFTDVLSGWDYVNYTLNPQGPGTMTMVGIANVQSGDVPPLRFGDYHLATIHIMTTYDPNLPGIFAPLTMPIDQMSENSLSDSSGYIVYHPAIDEGGVHFIGLDDILIGDINLNQYPYEIGDAVIFAEYLIDPLGHPFNHTQRLASDCNQDRIPATIADFVYLLNVINNGGGGSAGGPEPGFATLSLNLALGVASIRTDVPVGGVLIRISHPAGAVLDNLSVGQGLELRTFDSDDVLTALIYSPDSRTQVGADVLHFRIAAGDPKLVVIKSFEASDMTGRLFKQAK